VIIPPATGGGTVKGRITGYECGDNCYLTITDATGKEHNALCTARECAAWNDVGEMPQRYIGRKVVAALGRGEQYDGNDDLVGLYPAFRSIRFIGR
jgi:hypothetical protein